MTDHRVGRSIQMETTNNTIAAIRRTGRKGVRNARTKPSPNRDAGSTIHTGQISVIAPRIPATPLALFTLLGQLPKRVFQTASPLVIERSKPRITVKRISMLVAGGRGRDGESAASKPSSQAKSAPSTTKDTRKGSQNCGERRTRSIVRSKADRGSLHLQDTYRWMKQKPNRHRAQGRLRSQSPFRQAQE
jgi:hypothetical protein